MSEMVGAAVALRDGMIIDWQITAGRTASQARWHMTGRAPGDCEVVATEVTSFAEGERWMRQWPIHPKLHGFRPHSDG